METACRSASLRAKAALANCAQASSRPHRAGSVTPHCRPQASRRACIINKGRTWQLSARAELRLSWRFLNSQPLDPVVIHKSLRDQWYHLVPWYLPPPFLKRLKIYIRCYGDPAEEARRIRRKSVMLFLYKWLCVACGTDTWTFCLSPLSRSSGRSFYQLCRYESYSSKIFLDLRKRFSVLCANLEIESRFKLKCCSLSSSCQ